MVSMNGHGSDRPSKRRVTGKEVVPIGTLLVSVEARDHCEKHGFHPIILAARHASGDWGDLPEELAKINEANLKTGGRVMSAYKVGNTMVIIGTDQDLDQTRMDILS
jgi:hypothetical protein